MGVPVKREHVGLILVLIGLIVVLAGAYLAYAAYKSYKPFKASPGGIEETISVSVMRLVDLAFKLAYIGVIVWAGGILLRNGIEAYKPPRQEKAESK